jgi:hypothetical protein
MRTVAVAAAVVDDGGAVVGPRARVGRCGVDVVAVVDKPENPLLCGWACRTDLSQWYCLTRM